MKTLDETPSRCEYFPGLDTAAKSSEQHKLQPALRLRPSCAGITFEGRVDFAMPQRRMLGVRGWRKRTAEEVIEDFWACVQKDTVDKCWPWKAAKNECGYGTTNHGLAHRFCYAISKGQIPKGLCVLHKCDNPPCCNPAHLFLGTQQDNIRDCVSKQRQGAPRGESVHWHKLTEKNVIELRRLIPKGVSIASLAKRFKVAHITVYQAYKKISWRYLP